MARIPAGYIDDKGVRTDWVDLRDQQYLPNLSVLRSSVSLEGKLLRKLKATEAAKVDWTGEDSLTRPVFGVRDQGPDGRCVGFALANLIDIQRSLQFLRDPVAAAGEHNCMKCRDDIVSADMLYRMAFFHDRYPDLEDPTILHKDGVRTLRSAIKGFYHHGVCLDWPREVKPTDLNRWQSTCYLPRRPRTEPNFPSVDQAKSARKISLGAYFRLASVLNHFHTALNDVGAILVSANVHDGWRQATPANQGQITWPPELGKIGTHAFVIVGYDDKGFLVLNSWGEKWGGYKGQLGVGLWSYKDWAQNVVDSWVLRLGVPTPEAFGASIGEKGTKGITGQVQVGSMPCSELVGHYMHLDDGFHVVTGSYPTFSNSWTKTYDYLRDHIDAKVPIARDQKKYRGILVWIPGSFEGIKPAFSTAVQRKNLIKALGLYPYSIFWCNSFVEKSMEVLNVIFEGCKKQAGSDAEHLDELIESRIRGVGRAFWRDIEIGARRALRGTGELPFEPDDQGDLDRIKKGFVARFLSDLIELKKKHDCEIHIVAEGAGALVVHEMLALLEEDAERLAELEKRKDCTCGAVEPDKPEDNDEEDAPLHGAKAEDIIDTLHLVHPAIGLPRAQKVLLPFVKKVNGRIVAKRNDPNPSDVPEVTPLINSKKPRRAAIYLPEKKLEDRICFGMYGKSILHLVSRSFEDRYATPPDDDSEDIPVFRDVRLFLGMADVIDDGKDDAASKRRTENRRKLKKTNHPGGLKNLEEVEPFDAHSAVFQLNSVASRKHQLDRVPQNVLSRDPTITEAIFDCIRKRRDQ